MAGVRKKPLSSGKFQGWYTDHIGKQRFFTGTRNRAETKRMALRLDDEHRQIRTGYRPLAEAHDQHATRPLFSVVTEYLAWGKSQGGRGGRVWSETHARKREGHLWWWQAQLGVHELGHLSGCLPRVEAVLRSQQELRRAGKTLANYAETLRSFCRWCVERQYLEANPLTKLKPFDTTSIATRRALTVEEIQRLLDHCPVDQRLLLETAFCSGLRVTELRKLTPGHLDVRRGGLTLDAAWTKNRRPGFQPLPSAMLERLSTWVETKEALRLYALNFERGQSKGTYPKDPLLYVPRNPSRSLDRALKAAGISKVTSNGKMDFHACRVAYITMVFESGATLKGCNRAIPMTR
jgi:integrase